MSEMPKNKDFLLHQDEEDILLSHEYDGIRELDNTLPPWWRHLFLITVAFSVIYTFGYEVAGWFNQPIEEYNKEIAYYAKQEEEMVKQLMKEGLKPLTDEENLKIGREVFVANCASCHGNRGEGAAIGPNLTDEYWLSGKGKFEDVVEIVSDGVEGKAMQAWRDTLGTKRVLQVSSYVLSLQGSDPLHAKEPQGTHYPPASLEEESSEQQQDAQPEQQADAASGSESSQEESKQSDSQQQEE